MKLFAFLVLLVLVASTVVARPEFKDVDFKLFELSDQSNPGIAVDKVYDVITERPEDSPHHHHHHHKKMAKSNRLDRLKRQLRMYL